MFCDSSVSVVCIQFSASVSEDVTMATWGGSTIGNLEGIEETEGNSGGGERMDEDDGEDYW